MKKHLLIFFLLFCCINVFGQSVTINDLTIVSNLGNLEAHNYLVFNRQFKQQYIQDINGQTVEHLSRIGTGKKEETVIIGVSSKLNNGTILHTVTYTTLVQQNILNLIEQAKHVGLKLKFKGADARNDIFIFDNDFSHVVMFLNHNHVSGSVEVHQKEYIGYD